MKVVDMPHGGKPDEFRKALADFRLRKPDIVEYNRLEADITFQKYTDLKKAGFTEQQALDLCKTWRA